MEVLEKFKQIIEKERISEDAKQYYLCEIQKVEEGRLNEILSLIKKMEEAGFRNNFASAYSEITENIPQFGRHSVLRELHRIVRNVERNCQYADDLDKESDWKNLIEKFRKHFSKEEAEKFLQIYTNGVIANVRDLIDYGNPRAEEDDLNWVLLETKEDGSHQGRIITGMWEDDLNDEDVDWEKL